MLNLITESLDVWASAELPAKTGGRGRAASDSKSPHGIQKLRELILELAVRGKLLPQDPSDEPASKLLNRVAEKKAQLIKSKKLKMSKTSSRIYSDELVFDLPYSWARCPLEEYLDLNWGNTTLTKSSYSNSGVVAYSAAGPDGFIPHAEFNCEGIVISAIGARCGRCFYANGEWTAIKNTMTLIPYSGAAEDVQLRFILIVLSIPESFPRRGGAQPFLSLGDVRATQILVPPLREQKRIVAKVDELMALCDQLEQEQTDNGNAHQSLVETLLATLTQAEGDGDFAAAWQRIAEHFDTLFTTEQSIDQLKQTILQLAVMGKLVPQDPNDEPASELLKKIAAEKSRLIKEKKIKKQEPLPEISDDEKPFALPQGWEWARFDYLSLHSEAGWSPSCESIPRQGDNWGVLKVSAVTWGKYNPQENKALPANLESKPEFEVMPGDFLISRANTAELVARAVVVPNGAPSHLMMSDKIIRFVFAAELNREFLTLVNGSDYSREYYARVAGGTSSSMKNVSREQIRNLVVALPPLTEQHRIVAKVDELMALCDALKVRLNETQLTQVRLADAIVEQATVAV